MDDETVIAALDQAGIDRTLITGFDEFSSVHETFIPNELVAGLAERHPDRFIPFAGADVLAGMDAVRDFEHLVRDRGFRGLSVRPFMIGAARRRSPLLPAVREVRRARRAGQHPFVGQLDHRRRQRPRPPAPHRRRGRRLPGAEDRDEPRRLPLGAGGGAAGLEVPERLPGAGRAPAALPRHARHRLGAAAAVRDRRRSATRCCSARAGSCSAARRGRSSRSSARCRCPRTCSRCGCGATRRRCWARAAA